MGGRAVLVQNTEREPARKIISVGSQVREVKRKCRKVLIAKSDQPQLRNKHPPTPNTENAMRNATINTIGKMSLHLARSADNDTICGYP